MCRWKKKLLDNSKAANPTEVAAQRRSTPFFVSPFVCEGFDEIQRVPPCLHLCLTFDDRFVERLSIGVGPE